MFDGYFPKDRWVGSGMHNSILCLPLKDEVADPLACTQGGCVRRGIRSEPTSHTEAESLREELQCYGVEGQDDHGYGMSKRCSAL
jgi:hypothetical protein